MAWSAAGARLWRTSTSLFHRQTRPLSSHSSGLLPRTSLTRRPRPELQDSAREAEQQAAVVSAVNRLIAQQSFGRLFAVVHFAGRQWKVTNEDLILIENHIEAECGERIRMEKVLMVGAEEFSLVGRPVLGRELVQVEATVLEKTQSWPKVHMRFWKRHRFQRKRIIVQPQTVLRINSIQLAPSLM
ncbi:large ribosomal subunit protein bL21m [Genypterus blacodes]|uniref:large ribosomal subunit protein bL21m n=1 Tax=Genypterus blacodes TaxID=154954 RepID=UPI003F765D94